MRLSAGGGRVLDFDIENRPLSYWMPDRPTAQITAIASMWVGDHDSLRVDLLGPPCYHPQCRKGICRHQPEYAMTEEMMLLRFVDRYNEADLVTGHYIRRHDLPIINGALYDLGLPLLGPKMTSDTKLDMFKKADVPATQEHLLDLLQPRCPLGLELEKHHMSQAAWREANRLSPAGLEATFRRVSTDVHAHSHLRDSMTSLGMLRSPRLWDPGGGFSEVKEGRHR